MRRGSSDTVSSFSVGLLVMTMEQRESVAPNHQNNGRSLKDCKRGITFGVCKYTLKKPILTKRATLEISVQKGINERGDDLFIKINKRFLSRELVAFICHSSHFGVTFPLC